MKKLSCTILSLVFFLSFVQIDETVGDENCTRWLNESQSIETLCSNRGNCGEADMTRQEDLLERIFINCPKPDYPWAGVAAKVTIFVIVIVSTVVVSAVVSALWACCH